LQRHAREIAKLPPTRELKRSGWCLAYTAGANPFIKTTEELQHIDDRWCTYGLMISKTDVVMDSPRRIAGLADRWLRA